MQKLLVDFEGIYPEFKEKVKAEERKVDGKSVTMRDVIYTLVKIYISTDDLTYHTLKKHIWKTADIKKQENVTRTEISLEEQGESKQRARINRSSFSGLSK